MNEYTVAPNRDASKWIVKIEDVAPTDQYEDQQSAIDEATRIAEQNKPSKVIVLDANHEQIDEKLFS